MGTAKADIETLREKIRHHDYLYYVLDRPTISDKEYDDFYKRLKELEAAHPELITPDSPTQRVSGTPIKIFGQIKHRLPMLSLDNTYSEEEIRAWGERVQKLLERQRPTYVLNPKIDGLSLELIYEQGRLTKASTRGDGLTGEDVTANARTIKAIPLRLNGNIPPYVEVRGEVYMTTTDFRKMNDQLRESGEEPFANPRNAAAGSLRQKDATVTAGRPLKFFAHSLGQSDWKDLKQYSDFMIRCESIGIPVAKPFEQVSDIDAVISLCEKWKTAREKWPFETDGVVIRVDDLKQQALLGTTAKSPRWAIAFKYPAKQAITKLLDVVHSVGRTGVITPTASLEPVECGGVVISNASLHNYDEIERLGVKIGDTVTIERAGEVIPKVISVLTAKRTGDEKSIKTPTQCPACNSPLTKLKNEVAVRCVNPNCPAQLERSILHFVSRDAMDIEGMGEAVVQQLVRHKGLSSVADIYALKKEDFLELELFADKRAENLVAAIERSKKQSLDRFIYGLGIPNIGEKAGHVLAEHFGSIDALSAASLDELTRVPDVGPVGAASIQDFFKKPAVKQTLRYLKKAGLDPKAETIHVPQDSVLAGKTVVFTGGFKTLSRSEAEKRVRALGGNAAGSVSKKTHYVVAGEEAGSKLDKAKELGLTILTEEAFLKLINKLS